MKTSLAKSLLLILAILALSFSALGVTPAQAAGPFTVNTTADTHDANTGDGACADAGNNCSLRAAIT